MNYICMIPSPLGELTIASDGENLTGLWIAGQKYFAAGLKTDAVKRDLPVFETAKKWLECYFAGVRPEFEIPVKPIGSEFRQSVWRILQEIPYGETTTYGKIAKILSGSDSNVYARAVGGAVGHNPVSIIIPCHRVIASDRSLTGYAGGIEAKTYLLKLELEGKIN